MSRKARVESGSRSAARGAGLLRTKYTSAAATTAISRSRTAITFFIVNMPLWTDAAWAGMLVRSQRQRQGNRLAVTRIGVLNCPRYRRDDGIARCAGYEP